MEGPAPTIGTNPANAAPPRQPPRDRWLALAAIVLICGLSWLYLLYLSANMANMESAMAGMDMGGMEMSGMDMAGMAMEHGWTWLDALLMFVMWAVMMVAMMLPSASPMILLYQRIAHQRMKQPRLAVTFFASGYLLVWTAFSAIATTAQWVLREIGLVDDMMVSSSATLSGALLIAAGLYQLSPWKQTCLKHCQTPFTFVMQHWRGGKDGAFIMGLHHGGYCLGCCWLVMALLFVGGVMNLLWIAGLALLVLLEKVIRGIWLARGLGVVLVGAGIWLLLTIK